MTDNSVKKDDVMGGYEKVGPISEFPIGSVRKITVNGEARTLYHVDPSTPGVDAVCPIHESQLYCWHRHPETHPTIHCELSGTGVLQGKVVTCQTAYKPGCAHGSKFDVSTGERLAGPAPPDEPLVVYETTCVDGELWGAVQRVFPPLGLRPRTALLHAAARQVAAARRHHARLGERQLRFVIEGKDEAP